MKSESDIKKSLERDIVLFVSPSEKYSVFLEKIVSLHLKSKKKLGLISLNKTYSNLSNDLKKKKINADNILFIDCVSQKEGKTEKKKNVIYVSSPQAYTDINITTKKVILANIDANISIGDPNFHVIDDCQKVLDGIKV